MNLPRREFVKDSLAYLLSAANRASGGYRSALGFLALPGGLFAAPAGWKPKGKKPNLVFGILTDTHLMVEWDGKSLYRSMTLDYIRKAFKLFKSRNIDAFVHLGDASHRGCVREWEFHKEVFHEVFGNKDVPETIIIVGNHELMGNEGHCRGVYKDPALWRENAICADVARGRGRTAKLLPLNGLDRDGIQKAVLGCKASAHRPLYQHAADEDVLCVRAEDDVCGAAPVPFDKVAVLRKENGQSRTYVRGDVRQFVRRIADKCRHHDSIPVVVRCTIDRGSVSGGSCQKPHG